MSYTANGVYTLKQKDNGPPAGSVYARGTADGAVLTLGVRLDSGNIVDLFDGIISVPSDNTVHHGSLIELVVTISNAGASTDLEIQYAAH